MTMTRRCTRAHQAGLLAVLLVFILFTILFLPDLLPANKGSRTRSDGVVNLDVYGEALLNITSTAKEIDLVSGFLQSRDPLKPIPSASDDVYKRATEKGELLKCWMKNPLAAGELAKSKWEDFEQLKEWGWVETITTQHGDENKPGLKEILGEFEGEEAWTNQNKLVRLKHVGERPEEGGVSYPPTNAMYENAVYPSRGVLVADSNWSPQSRIALGATAKGREWDSKTMKGPELHRLSDILYLIWKKFTTPTQPSTLRSVVIRNIVNDPTQQVIARALKDQWPEEEHPALGRAPVWPGKGFTPEMEGFAAILGVEGIWAVPWLVLQHSELGKLEIKSVTVWNERVNNVYYQPNAVVELGAVGEGE